VSGPWYEHSFGERYLRLYAHRDAREAERALETLFPGHALAGRTALDLACGSGRYLQLLHERGAKAVGLDLSEVLLGDASERFAARGIKAPLVRADMRRIPFVDLAFDVVLSMFTSFGYFETVAAHEELSREMGRVTRAVIVLDLPDIETLVRDLVPESERRLEDRRVRERRWLEADPMRVVKEITIADSEGGQVQERYEERVMLFSRAEVDRMFRAAGFRVVDVLGDYSGSPWVAGRSPRMLMRLQRRTRP
jgi:SAM-dependent methyltransferase